VRTASCHARHFEDTVLIRIGFDGRIMMQYEVRGFARHTIELIRAMKEIAEKKASRINFRREQLLTNFPGS